MSVAYLVIPRQRTSSGMVECPSHLATEFAVYRETTHRNKRCTSIHRTRKLLSVFTTARAAEVFKEECRVRYSAPGKRTIGQRFGDLQRPAIYGSSAAPMHKGKN